MGFLEGSKSVSTSIGGSTQTINFTPVLNARGATSGGTVGGVTQNQTPTVTTTQTSGAGGGNGQGGESGGLLPALSLSSNRPVEAISTGNPNYLSQSDRSFTPARLDRGQVDTGEVVELSTGLLLAMGVAAIALWMVWR